MLILDPPDNFNLKVEFAPVIGGDWGEQIGWLRSAPLPAGYTDLVLHMLPVFRVSTTGSIRISLPSVPGAYPASRHTVLTFPTGAEGQRYLAQLEVALRAARPDLFADRRAEA